MLKTLRKILRFFIPLLLISFILFNIYSNRQVVLSFWMDFNPIPLIVSFFLMLLIFIEAGFNWHILLNKLNFPISFKKSLYIFIISNAGRYIPGSIWQYIGRVELGKKEASIPREINVLSLVLEIFILVNAALIVSLLAVPFIYSKIDNNYFWLLLAPFSLILMHPLVARNIIKTIAKFTGRDIGSSLASIRFTAIFSVLPFFILNFLLNGLAIFFLTEAVYPEVSLLDLVFFTGVFAFSWVVGFVSIIAPAGLGVTDLLLAYLLSLVMPLPLASTIALSYRVFLTLAELAVFLWVLRSGSKQEPLDLRSSWEERSQKFGNKVEGVATKSLPIDVNRKLDRWMFVQIEKVINNNLKQRTATRILDLGCGYGRLSKPLLDKYLHVKTYGIDISKNYVNLYNKNLYPRGKAAEGDIKELKFKDNYFDGVFMVTTLMYLTARGDQLKAIREILRVLKPGGKLVIIERSRTGYFLFTFGGLISLIRGSKNREIPAVSIDEKELKIKILESGGRISRVAGLPFLSLMMPLLIISSKINSNIFNLLLKLANYYDGKFPNFTYPSLYISYQGDKPAIRE